MELLTIYTEEELKKILKTITPNVDTYYGEFSSLNDIKIDHNKMPAIFVLDPYSKAKYDTIFT